MIGEVARLAGVTVKAVRHYHQRGLLPEPPRQPNGYRAYSPEHLLILVRIRKLREAGLSLGAIAELLSSAGPADPVPQLKGLLRELEAERDELEGRVRSLHALVDGLGRGANIEASDLAPPSFTLAEPSLKRLGATRRLLDAERRIWAVLDAVSWGPATDEGNRHAFGMLTADKGRARELAAGLDSILREIDAGATAEELVPLVEQLVHRFPPRGTRPPTGDTEPMMMSALVMSALPKPLADALRIVANRAEG